LLSVVVVVVEVPLVREVVLSLLGGAGGVPPGRVAGAGLSAVADAPPLVFGLLSVVVSLPLVRGARALAAGLSRAQSSS
jgi:hypothetical protein